MLKKALWKEAAIEIISLYGIFDSTESGRSHHYHNIATMCHESSVILFNEDQGNVSIPHGYGAFVLSGKIQINEETKERYTYISAVAKDSDVKLSSNTVLLVVPPTALALMKLKSPLLETQHDSLGRVLQSLAFSSKEEKMEILSVTSSVVEQSITKLVEKAVENASSE